MKKLGKSLSKYLLMSMVALMLVCFGTATAFAAGSITGTEVSGDEGSGEDVRTAEMLAKLDYVRLAAENTVYSGKEAEPPVKLLYTDEKLDVKDSDVTGDYVFSISCTDKNCTDVSGKKAVVTATVTGYYNGDSEVRFDEPVQLSAEFEITPLDVSQTAAVAVSDVIYNGTAQKPAVKVKAGGKTLVSGTDYTVTAWENNKNVGTATVTVTFKGNYSGTASWNFKITPLDVSQTAAVVVSDVTYNGTAQKPAVKVKAGEKTLVSGTDYTVTAWENNKNVGTATVTVTFKGNYSGTASWNFKITPLDVSQTAAVAVSDVIYNGTAQKPAVKVKAGGKTLVSGTDYTVTAWENNKNAGTAKVTVTFKGNYSGTATGSFKISPRKITSLSLSSSSFTYNGTAQKPDLTVKADTVKLSSSNYTVTITDSKGNRDSSINAGTKTVTVKGKGNYTGTLTKNYKIKAKSISSASVSLSTTKYVYNGKTRKPAVTVKIKLASKTVTLKKNRDYTVSYSTNCKSIGTKKVTIKGTGNYSGQITKSFKIVPEKATGLKVSSRGTGSLKLTCTKAKTSGCKYEFLLKQYNASAKKWEQKAVKKVSSNTATFTGLDSGRAYVCYVRIYKKSGSVSYTGAWSSVLKTATSPSKPVMSYAVRTGSKSLKAVWKAVSSATGYEVQYSTKSDFSSNVKTVKVKGRTTTSKTISGLNSSGTYYVRVRAYRTYNGKTYRGSWSSKVSTYYSNVYASYTTYYNSGNTNRSTNLRLACNAINGTILSDGETFSFNGIVGERTAAKGYKEAIIYEGGQEVGGIGGGICQVATTLFNAALRANFTIVERHQHSLTVHYCPLGYDAAISWGSKNLRFRNNSGTSVMVDIHATGGTLSVKFLTNVYRKPPAVSTSVTVRNGVYTLRRSVNGKVNYTTTSDYMDN